MELFFNPETNEYVFHEEGKSLVVTEKEFEDMRKFGMSGVLLRLSKDEAKSRVSSV